MLSTVFHRSVDGLNAVGGKTADTASKGTVTNKALFGEAQKAKCGIDTTSNFFARDAEQIAANLSLDREAYFAKPTQIENLDALCTNIRYQSDDITLRDTGFDAINFKDGGTTGGRKAFAQGAARTPHIQSERSDTHIVFRISVAGWAGCELCIYAL